MPPDDRQIQPSDDPAADVLARVWRQAPVGLTLVEDGVVAAWNPEARRLLEGSVGGMPAAWRRWLESAALRLWSAPDRAAVINARLPQAPALELRLANDGRRDGPTVLAVRAVPVEAAASGGGLSETVSTLSHELRTPLAAMKSSLALVLGGETGPLSDDQRRFLGVALRNATRLDRLVGDLLDLARDDAGRLPVECRSIDVAPVLREALALFDGAGEPVGPRLDSSGIPGRFTACVDPDKLVQIVSNLVGNARKYVPASGRVRVWIDPHPAGLDPVAATLARACGLDVRTFALVVEDNGPGIDPQIVDRVFEPFERGRAEVIGHIGGAGLGLHIVRRLTEAHGGKVSLATAPGAGTTVWVRLPVDAASARVLRAAAHLASVVEPAPGRAGGAGYLAVLDGRDAPEPPAAAMAAVRSGCAGVVGKICEPAPGLAVAAVADLAAWQRDTGPAAAGWRLVGLPGSPADPVPGPAVWGKPGRMSVDNDS